MKRFLTLILVLSGLSVSCTKEAEKPNVIVLLVDDLGWGDIGYNNPEKVYTPNMDALAASGITFTQHYSMPQCTPTRVAVFTGRYPGRFGTTGLMAANKNSFPKVTPTLATMFREAGYETYLCGKWHMGSTFEHGPAHFGFDRSYGSLTGAVGMYDHRYREGEYEFTWHRDMVAIEGTENGTHATDLVAGDAIRFIREDRERPFFMYLAFHAPHTPLDERGAFKDRPTQPDPEQPERWLNEDEIPWFNDPEGKIQNEPDPEKRLLLAVVHHLDYAIGEVVRALEETGKRENTLILFSSDNGPQVNWGGNAYPDDLHLTDFNQPIPMRGRKLDVYEGGIHVPGFASWPAVLERKEVDQAVHVIDWFPTLAALLGFEEAKEYQLDGKDLGGLLFHDKALEPRPLYWIWHTRTNRWALRFGDWKIVKYGEEEPVLPDDWQLFKIDEDPEEEHDLGSENPEKREELHKLFLVERSKDKITPE